MISLICTHCQTELSIDDAFAGGVCRCQHCGTIQTVPSSRSNDPSATDKTDAGAGRSLYQTQSRETRVTTRAAGLEELADIVASSGLGSSGIGSGLGRKGLGRNAKGSNAPGGSGLAGSGLSGSSLRRKNADQSNTAAGETKPNRLPLIIIVGSVLVLGGILCAWLAINSANSTAKDSGGNGPLRSTGAGPAAGAGTSSVAPAVASSGPQFCGMPIAGTSIIYLLDRGDSANEIFDALKQATYGSIATLGADRKFQILFWDNHTDDVSYPPIAPTDATPENLAACTKLLDDVTAYHQSDITKPLQKAIAENPDLIIIATAKGFELDDQFRSAVESITRGTNVKLDTISLHGSDCAALRKVATDSGGIYKAVSDDELRAAAR